MARPEEENPLDKARANTEKIKKRARSQLTTRAATERARIGAMREAADLDDAEIGRAGSKALARATGRQAQGIAGLSGLGSLQMDVEGQRRQARKAAADNIAQQERTAQDAEQEITKFDIESTKSEDDIKQEREDLNTELNNIAVASASPFGGENENKMADMIENWARDTKPTKREWESMVRKAADEYGVGVGMFNRPLKIPIFDEQGRFVRF